jgi:hypothetical protein
MDRLKAIGSELIGLFVDDVSFAAAIILWQGLIWLLSLHAFRSYEWRGIVFFGGLGLILLESTMRRSRR